MTELRCVFGSNPELVSEHRAGWIEMLVGCVLARAPYLTLPPPEPTGRLAPGERQTCLEPTTDIPPSSLLALQSMKPQLMDGGPSPCYLLGLSSLQRQLCLLIPGLGGYNLSILSTV